MKAAFMIVLLVFLAFPGLTAAGGVDDPFSVALAALAQDHTQPSRPTGPVMTLREIEEVSLQNNPEIRVAAHRVSLAQIRIGAAGALEDATFMYRGWGVPLSQPWNFNRSQNMFMVAQPIPGPGKRGLRDAVARQQVETAQAKLDARKRQVVAEARMAYFELLRQQDELRLHDEQVALARQALESAEIKYTVGRVPQQDTLRAHIALTRLIDHLIMLHTDGDLARARLNRLMGRDPAASLEVAGDYKLPRILPTSAELQRTALGVRPELVAAASEIRRSELGTQLAEKAYTPDFTLAGGYMLMPGGTGESRHGYMAELSINLPWLNRRKHDSEIGEARAAESLQRSEYDSMRLAVFHEIQEARIRAEAVRRSVELYESTQATS